MNRFILLLLDLLTHSRDEVDDVVKDTKHHKNKSKKSKEIYFDTQIKKLRFEHDMTQGDLAQKVGVSRETISYLEKGKYNPSLKLARDVAQVFDKNIEEVFIFIKGGKDVGKSKMV